MNQDTNCAGDRYFAHTLEGKPEDLWEPLPEHLTAVATCAQEFAAAFGAGEEAHFAGLLHDMGKYGRRFLSRLRGEMGGIDHWSVGAYLAACLAGRNGIAAALSIQGHHIGLQQAPVPANEKRFRKAFYFDGDETTHPLRLKWSEANPDPGILQRRLHADGLKAEFSKTSLFDPKSCPVGAMLDVRMLFSALVDADFLATEAHFNQDSGGKKVWRNPGPTMEPDGALAALEDHVRGLSGDPRATAEMRALRQDLFRACWEAGHARERGCYTLTAPTGAGKTLAMLAFALRHAQRHGLRRIVFVVPYLSIIEQTAGEYRKVFRGFGEHFVLEHHSLAGVRSLGDCASQDGQDERERTRRLLSENWDAPIVVTTSVQALESLFANTPSACRKLHRLAESVILFDEVQTLPSDLAVYTLAALARLVERYGASVVLATATQPAFDHVADRVAAWCRAGWVPRELVPAELKLFERTRRVKVDWETARSPADWECVAGWLTEASCPQALCIVNLKRHALGLTERLQERGVDGLFHLSTNMCPQHRKHVLEEVRARLAPGSEVPCRLVATQCVEAGVDVDFPVVYRAMGPLEAIAQAAGRCNRGGRLAEGRVVVFRPPADEGRSYPDDAYDRAAQTAEDFIGRDLNDPETYREYYRRRFDLNAEDLAKKSLDDALKRLDFAEVSRMYRLIKDDAVNVVVPYDRKAYEELRKEAFARRGLTLDWIRRARPYVVNVFRFGRTALENLLEPLPVGRKDSEDWFFLIDRKGEVYDNELCGLRDPELGQKWIL